MANIPATLNNSDFALPATWLGGVVPGANDVAFLNGKIVRVSSTRTIVAFSILADTGIIAGGGLVFSNGVSLTVTAPNGILYGAATGHVVTTDLAAGQSASLSAGTTTGSDTVSQSFALVNHSTAGTFNVSGNYAGVTRGLATIEMSSTGTLNITGNVSSGGGFGGSLAPGVRLSGNGTVNHTGNVLGSNGSAAVGALNSSTSGVYNLTGNYTGGFTGAGIENTSTGTFNAIGVGRSGTGAPAIGRGSVNQVTRISGPLELGSSGNVNPKQAQSIRWAPTLIPTSEQVVLSNGTTRRDLYTADNMPTGGYPVVSNVVALTIYGPNNEFTGTYATPPVSSVAQGVPVGNTVGTAVLTPASVRAAIGLDGANLDAQLANKATVDQVAAIVQGATSV